MAGLTLSAIRDALAAQIRANIDRSVTVHARNPGGRSGRNIVITPETDYIEYALTMGPNGQADVFFAIDIECPAAQLDSAQIALDDFLSVGQGNTSSVVDAIQAGRDTVNGALGGLVADVVCLTADGPNLDADPITARLHVHVIVHKIGAQP
jgi:hypothetical protein